MSKKRIIQFKCIFLLLLYVFSNSPAIIFHHHKAAVVNNEVGKQQEKQLQFVENNNTVEHGKQFETAAEKCALCNHHTLSSYTITNAQDEYLGTLSSSNYSIKSDFLFFRNIEKGSSRAPPIA